MNPLMLPTAAMGDLPLPHQSGLQLPKPPPNGAGLWDPGNRHKTLLAIGAGLLSGGSFADGVGRAGSNVLQMEDELKAQSLARRPQREYGGPDGAFEIVTDPATGARSVQEVKQFADYAAAKRTKAKDTADINGRAMAAIQELPETDRAEAYQVMLQHPDYFGIDPQNMPATYDPHYADMTARMGMTVAQAQTRATAQANAASQAEARSALTEDRKTRTGAYVSRAGALTTQGNRRLDISASKGRGAASSGGAKRTHSSNSDLSYLLQ